MRNAPPTDRPLKNMFASDNYAGICPEAWAAMAEVNQGFVTSYGDDPWTAKACDALRDFFETDCQVFFVFNGTAGNSLALSTLCRSYHSIICHELAHVETDECGAAEFYSNGTKLLTVPGASGKVGLEAVRHTVHKRSDIHYPKPQALSITQATELGTVYSVTEMQQIGETARELGLRLHVDGARFANALAALNAKPRELSWEAGVDVMTLGGTKEGLAVGEAVVFFNLELAEEFDYRCKQAGQLASKMRFLSAPWLGLLRDDTLLRHARHANSCAFRLGEGMAQIPGISLMNPVEVNGVFVEMPQAYIDALFEKGWYFYTFIGEGHARFMCSWATRMEDVHALLNDLREVAGA